jgi:hypothetical protein
MQEEIIREDQEDGKGRALQKHWLSRITKEEKAHRDIRDKMKRIYKVWKDDLANEDQLYVPLWWSVCQVQHTGVYSSQPIPDCRPRHESQNPAFKTAARVLERGIAFCVDDQSFDDNMHRAVDEYLALGLGVVRVKVDSVIVNEWTGEVNLMGARIMAEKIQDQTLRWEFVPYDRFGWEPAQNWKHVDFIYFRHPMDQSACKQRFGRRIRGSKKDVEQHGREKDWQKGAVDIYEIWDRKHKKVLFFAKGEPEPIEVIDDPLSLANFYPCPLPMMTNPCSHSFEPQPDYDFIEPYDTEINRLQERRMSLLEQIKAVSMHDASMPELAELFELEDGESKPVDKLLARLGDGGTLENIMMFPALSEKMEVLGQITEQIQFVKAQVDEILGIADIVRGVTSAAETATAQEIKGRWVGLRLTPKRDLVQYTVREMFRIMGQLLCSIFTDENLARMTQMEIPQESLQVLRDDLMMQFVIDIESESTVAKDEYRERETRQSMMDAVGAYASSVLPMVQQGFMPAGVSSAILQAALQPYTKYSRHLDEELTTLQTTEQQLQQMSQQLQQEQQTHQQTQQQMQQWQQVATVLQQQATEAKSAKEKAEAELKKMQVLKTAAETDKIRAETGETGQEPVDPLDRLQKAADIDKTQSESALNEAKRIDTLRVDPKPRTVQ